MNLIKSIIVDDEPFGIVALEKLIQFQCPEVQVIGSCTNAQQAIAMIKELQPDLVFLDVKMPGKNGFDLLRELDPISFEIIFVTAHSDYMMQAFHYSAVDYLLKPIDDELLEHAVKRAGKRIEMKSGNQHVETFLHNIRHIQQPKRMKLCIASVKGFQVIDLDDIIYCEASSSYTNFHFTNRNVICASKPIHEYETILADNHFMRVHKSYLINMDYIKEYIKGDGGSVILSNGQRIEVSRRKKDLLIRKMKESYKF